MHSCTQVIKYRNTEKDRIQYELNNVVPIIGVVSIIYSYLQKKIAVQCADYGFILSLNCDIITWWGNVCLNDVTYLISQDNEWKKESIVKSVDTNFTHERKHTDGTVIRLTDVKKIYSTHKARAALLGDGTVNAWGWRSYGGDAKDVQAQLTDIECIYSNYCAFAAKKRNGQVITWGDQFKGGDSSLVKSQLFDVEHIYSNTLGFVAILKNKKVVVWGEARHGLSIDVNNELYDIQSIHFNSKAFVAHRKDDTIITWGDSDYGGVFDCDLLGGNFIYESWNC
jgi:hypothetical protein